MDELRDDPLAWSAADQEHVLQTLAPWYDLDFGGLTDDVEMIAELSPPGARVLELGAGSGRIAAPLADAGCLVTAVDSSEAMLSVGEARMRDAGIEIVRGDMRCIDLGDRFDRVVVGLSTFQHLLRRSDQLAALQTARRHLAERGQLIIDWTAPRADDVEPSPPQFRLEWVRTTPSGEAVTKQAAQELALDRECGEPIDRAAQIAWITYRFDVAPANGMVRQSTARFPLRVNLNVGEMAGLLAEARLRPIDWFGSWQFDPAGDGERLIVIAEAAG